MNDVLVGVLIALLSAVGFFAYARRDAAATRLTTFLAGIGFAGVPREKLVAFCGRTGILYAIIALVIAGMWIIPAILR